MSSAQTSDAVESEDDLAEYELTPEEKDLLREKQLGKRIARIPEPTLEYITAVVDEHRTKLKTKMDKLAKRRQTRHQETKTPDKVLLTLDHTTRIFSCTTNTELNRVTATLTKNFPEVWIPSSTDEQQRFFNAWLAEIENDNVEGFFAPTIDSFVEGGLAFWEFYVDPEAQDMISDLERDPGEDDKSYNRRVGGTFKEAGRILNLRVVDMAAVGFTLRDGRLHCSSITEDKPWPVVNREWDEVQSSKPDEDEDGEYGNEREAPEPGDRGWPAFFDNGDKASSQGTVQTIRYYDDRWYAYICDGRFVDGPREHGFPWNPMVMGTGIVTSSSNLGNRYQGHLEGITALEDAADTELTIGVDAGITFGRPKMAAELPESAPRIPDTDDEGNDREPIDLRDPTLLLELEPGQKVINIWQGWQLDGTMPSWNRLMSLIGRASMNDVASGESPGADVASYTVNALQTSALTPFDPFIKGFQGMLARGILFAREYYRRLDIPIHLASPESAAGEPKWVVLKPKAIDRTPVRVTVSPLSDTQKLQVASALSSEVRNGAISEYTASRANPMVADPEQEALRKDMEAIHPELRALAWQDWQIRKGLIQPTPPPGMVQDPTMAPPTDGSVANPNPPQPPTVGAAQSQASRGPGLEGRGPGPMSSGMQPRQPAGVV